MIEVHRNKYARWIYLKYIRSIMKKSFSNFYLCNDMPVIPKDSGLIITPNHISWWDGFFVDHLMTQLSDRKIHLMMLENQLRKFWFFKQVGAYSINPDNPKSIIETANYTKSILSDSNNYVVIYPQGEIETYEKRPLNIKEGLKIFARRSEKQLYILPIGFKIQYYTERKPVIISRFGELINAESINRSYSDYIKAFHDNLSELSECSYKKEFFLDLFKRSM